MSSVGAAPRAAMAASHLPPLLPSPPTNMMLPLLPTPPRNMMLPLLPTPCLIILATPCLIILLPTPCLIILPPPSMPKPGRADSVERWDVRMRPAGSATPSSSNPSGGIPGRANPQQRTEATRQPSVIVSDKQRRDNPRSGRLLRTLGHQQDQEPEQPLSAVERSGLGQQHAAAEPRVVVGGREMGHPQEASPARRRSRPRAEQHNGQDGDRECSLIIRETQKEPTMLMMKPLAPPFSISSPDPSMLPTPNFLLSRRTRACFPCPPSCFACMLSQNA
ncbi:hypothetical protein ABZP36_009578 [Zizania latifolia]